MDEFIDGTLRMYEGLRRAQALMPHLSVLAMRMVAQADQLEAARQSLLAGNLKLRAAADQLAAVAERLREIHGGN